MDDTLYEAIVQDVILNGKHGPYAVARSLAIGSITFSLDAKVWQEPIYPDEGACVMLSQIRKKRAGWRAEHGRFLQPSDIR
jgi:hypothetical protein